MRTGGEIAAPGTLASHYAPAADGGARRSCGGRHPRARVRRNRTARRVARARAGGRRRTRSGGGARTAARRRRLRAGALRPIARGRRAGRGRAPRGRPRRRRGIWRPRSRTGSAGRRAEATTGMDAAPGYRGRPMPRDERPIGVFDSGLGGLTVVRALLDLVPDEHILYFGDTGRFPYGPKPADEVLKYSLEITDVLLARDVKMIVVACNSASAAALDHLQTHVGVPATGVIEPGIRAARRATRSGRIGVIGTVGTIASGAYQRAAAALDPDARGHLRRVPGLRRVRRGGRRRVRPGARARRTAAGPGDRGRGRHARARLHALSAARAYDRRRHGPRRRARLERGGDRVRRSEPRSPRRRPSRDRRRIGSQFVTSGDVETFRRLGARFCGPEVEVVEAWSWS